MQIILGPYVKDTSQQTSTLKHKVLVFDSGVGGLSVVAEIRKLLPNLSIDYLADDAFRPYGEKTVEAILERLPELISTLDIMLKPDAIVIACNTASTTALAAIRKKVSTPVIGVVPAIKPAAEMSVTKKIAVLGTPGTVRRQYVDDLIDSFAKNCSVKLRGTLKLVDYAERKLSGETIDTSLIAADIEPLFSKAQITDIDTIVLACTHFPLLREELEMITGPSVNWIDSGAAIARRVEQVLLKIKPQARERRKDIAFLMGPDTTSDRANAFQGFGFNKVIGLMS